MLTAVAEECDVYVVADGDQPQGVAHEISHEPVGVDHHNVCKTNTLIYSALRDHSHLKMTIIMDECCLHT